MTVLGLLSSCNSPDNHERFCKNYVYMGDSFTATISLKTDKTYSFSCNQQSLTGEYYYKLLDEDHWLESFPSYYHPENYDDCVCYALSLVINENIDLPEPLNANLSKQNLAPLNYSQDLYIHIYKNAEIAEKYSFAKSSALFQVEYNGPCYISTDEQGNTSTIGCHNYSFVENK